MRITAILLILLSLISCRNSNDKPDVENIHISVDVKRFDRAFFSIDTLNLQSSIQSVAASYPNFLPRYFEFFSPINFMVYQQGKTYPAAVKEYYRNIKPLYDGVNEKFKSFSSYQKELENNFRYVKYYYPQFKIPAIITSVESLNPENAEEIYGTVFFHDTLVISLQMFMGKDYPAYDPTQYFDYLRRRFEPQYIVPNSLREITRQIYPDSSQTLSLIEQMVEKGKQWYLLDKFLPDTPDSLKTGYTKNQLAWCKENEGNIWAAIVKNVDLYTVDADIIQNYIGEAPFSQAAGMPEQITPGNIGQWVGWQIVRKYASLHKDRSPSEIVKVPSRQLFNESSYKPK